MRLILAISLLPFAVYGQEASSGFDLRTTLGAETFYSGQLTEMPRSGSPFSGGVRAMLYPVWKINRHWTVSGTVEVASRPYSYEDFSTQGYGLKSNVLQAHLSYSQFWKKASLVVRAGQLSSAFGSFLLRYDDADNALIDVPAAYGYYYKSVTALGLMGAQMDATLGRWDARAQFVNSSPANPRGIFERDQYGNWTGGAGFTPLQGLRFGASAYRGPYLDRHSRFYFHGEAKPRDLPGSAIGMDVEWARGHWNVYGEWQKFQMDYRLIPTFHLHTGYAEVRRVLNPRWYVAARAGYTRPTAGKPQETYETAVGFRPAAHQLIKLGYEIVRGPGLSGAKNNVLAVQFVTSLHVLSIARNN